MALPVHPTLVTSPTLAVFDLHLLVRWLHVLTVALLVGGAVTTWLLVARLDSDGRRGARTALAIAEHYEWLFWLAVGVVVATGVGNLGAFAPHVPEPGTAWGTTFAVKLVVVVGLLVFSAGRTAFVRLLTGRTPTRTTSLGRAYALTAGALVLVLALAEVLAHG